MCKSEKNEILNREIKGWKQATGILKTGTSGREREREEKQSRCKIFVSRESVIEEKWEREKNEGKDKNNFLSFVRREGNYQINAPEI